MIQLCYCVCFCESAWFVQQFQFGGNFKNFGEYLAADFVVYLLKKKKKGIWVAANTYSRAFPYFQNIVMKTEYILHKMSVLLYLTPIQN